MPRLGCLRYFFFFCCSEVAEAALTVAGRGGGRPRPGGQSPDSGPGFSTETIFIKTPQFFRVPTGAAAASASGPITGFGSVIVNGIHFDESHAIITDADGAPHHRDDLKLGMTTQIRGSALVLTGNETRSAADSIVFSSAILGPIE